MLIFLDLDGVLRRDHSALWQLEPPLRELFEETVADFPAVEVVISSGWREVFPLDEIRGHFSRGFGARIVGATPVASPELRARTDHYRYHEVVAYLQRRRVPGQPWVALDDDPLHYPRRDNVRILDPGVGFDAGAAAWVRERAGRYGLS